MATLILIIYFATLIIGEKLHCPHNVPYFSTAPCSLDTNTFRCPPGYRCRPGRDENNTNNVYFICCMQSEMSVQDYFLESDLSPGAVPQVPLSLLPRVVLFDRASSQRLQIQSIDAEVSGVDQTQNDTASYSQLDLVEFQFPLDITSGQFLHFIVSQQPLSKPRSIHLYYDYPSFGTSVVNLTEMDQRMRRGFVEYISNETVINKEFYRNQFVVLAFRTETQLLTTEILPRNMDTEILQIMQNSTGDLSKFLSSKLINEKMGVPIGGIFFSVTSRGTIFTVKKETPPVSLADQKFNLYIITLLLLNFIITQINQL